MLSSVSARSRFKAGDADVGLFGEAGLKCQGAALGVGDVSLVTVFFEYAVAYRNVERADKVTVTGHGDFELLLRAGRQLQAKQRKGCRRKFRQAFHNNLPFLRFGRLALPVHQRVASSGPSG